MPKVESQISGFKHFLCQYSTDRYDMGINCSSTTLEIDLLDISYASGPSHNVDYIQVIWVIQVLWNQSVSSLWHCESPVFVHGLNKDWSLPHIYTAYRVLVAEY